MCRLCGTKAAQQHPKDGQSFLPPSSELLLLSMRFRGTPWFPPCGFNACALSASARWPNSVAPEMASSSTSAMLRFSNSAHSSRDSAARNRSTKHVRVSTGSVRTRSSSTGVIACRAPTRTCARRLNLIDAATHARKNASPNMSAGSTESRAAFTALSASTNVPVNRRAVRKHLASSGSRVNDGDIRLDAAAI